jgi:hypothetical protein
MNRVLRMAAGCVVAVASLLPGVGMAEAATPVAASPAQGQPAPPSPPVDSRGPNVYTSYTGTAPAGPHNVPSYVPSRGPNLYAGSGGPGTPPSGTSGGFAGTSPNRGFASTGATSTGTSSAGTSSTGSTGGRGTGGFGSRGSGGTGMGGSGGTGTSGGR